MGIIAKKEATGKLFFSITFKKMTVAYQFRFRPGAVTLGAEIPPPRFARLSPTRFFVSRGNEW